MTNVLLLYNDFIPSVRLCGYEQLNYLKKSGKIEFAHSNVRDLTNQQASDADVVFMVRSDSYLEMKIAEKLKIAGKYLIYVLDDDILNIPDGLSSSFYYKRKEVKNRIQKIMSLCNCLCSPSPLILDKYKSGFNKIVLIEEPALFNCKDINNKNSDKIKIGFAGSIDRSIDIDLLLKDALSIILEKYKENVEIEFFGSKPKFIDEFEMNYYPYENNYEEYQKKMIDLGWDIGLAPMQNTPFHHYKHYNKYIEYSSFGIVGIYSNVMPYTRVIENGVNGLLCNNTKESWVCALSNLIEDEKKRNKIKENIQKSIADRFLINVVSENFYSEQYEIFKYTAHSNANINIKFSKLQAYIVKCIEFSKRYGIKFPYEIVKRLIKK
ncbi:MAG: glycosyltransferase [Sedimentibacter saalensis]|uniref:glycosyltransferase n=1 Tax=Sedimentibacter saalensis TaxID=130788 RepID=UPI00315956D0